MKLPDSGLKIAGVGTGEIKQGGGKFMPPFTQFYFGGG
jgi:hypothetical protein